MLLLNSAQFVVIGNTTNPRSVFARNNIIPTYKKDSLK